MGIAFIFWTFLIPNIPDDTLCAPMLADLSGLESSSHQPYVEHMDSFRSLVRYLTEADEETPESDIQSAAVEMFMLLYQSNLEEAAPLELGWAILTGQDESLIPQLSRIGEYDRRVFDIFSKEFLRFLFSALSTDYPFYDDDERVQSALWAFVTSIPRAMGLLEFYGLDDEAEFLLIKYIQSKPLLPSDMHADLLMRSLLLLGSTHSSDLIASYAAFGQGALARAARKIIKKREFDSLIYVESIETVLYQLAMQELSPLKRRVYILTAFLKPVVRPLMLMAFTSGDFLTGLAMRELSGQLEATSPLELTFIEFLKRRGAQSAVALDTLRWVEFYHPLAAVRAAATEAIGEIR